MAAKTGYERVKAARSADRPTGLDYVNYIFSDFVELHGDRRFADDAAIVGGIARLGDRPVTVLPLRRGTIPRIAWRATSACPIPRAIARRCASCTRPRSSTRPVICFVDTGGGLLRHRRRGAGTGTGHCRKPGGYERPEDAHSLRPHRRGRLRRRIGIGRGRPGLYAGECRLFGDFPRGLCQHSLERCGTGRRRQLPASSSPRTTPWPWASTEEVIPEDQLGTPGFYDDLAFKLRQGAGIPGGTHRGAASGGALSALPQHRTAIISGAGSRGLPAPIV